MPIFKKKNSNKYLLTNYKVMYSTLKFDKNLERARMNKELKLHILLNWFFLGSFQFYFIARNPYDKLGSFFKEKFRNSLGNYERKGFWQPQQILFFSFLGIDERMSPDLIKQKLNNTSFSEFLSILPKIYMLDNHLRPQWYKKIIKIRKYNIPIKIIKVFKIESKEDLLQLQTIFNIDITTKVNSTRSIIGEIIWTEKELQLVEILYEKDFKVFRYKKRSLISKRSGKYFKTF